MGYHDRVVWLPEVARGRTLLSDSLCHPSRPNPANHPRQATFGSVSLILCIATCNLLHNSGYASFICHPSSTPYGAQKRISQWYRKYALGDQELERLEREAREAQRRLWRDKEPVSRWTRLLQFAQLDWYGVRG
jgi:hypothetical protein